MKNVMRTKAERTHAQPPATADDNENDNASGKTVIRVKRGALRRFDQLKTKSAGLPVEVKWDRRTSERRSDASPAGPDRRRKERRQAPPFTWDAADFVIVGDRSREPEENDSEPEAREATTSRSRRRS
jgi:hypothetical protein